MNFEKSDIYRTLATLIGALSLIIFNNATSKIERMALSMNDMKESVSALNVRMATVTVQMAAQTSNDTKLSVRIDRLEQLLSEKMKDRWTKQDHKDFAKDIKIEIKELRDKIESIEEAKQWIGI